jgi:Gliding motility associated protein GldN
MPMEHFIEKAKTDAQIPLFDADSWREKTKLEMAIRKTMFNSTDTINQIDPVTYETKVRVVQNNIKISDLKKLRLVQEWAWDNKKKALSVRLVGVAPMRAVLNEAEEFMFLQPLFYRRFD